jgi:uncharacterized coiled-coil protein SlyX
MNARYSESPRGAALPPRSATYVKSYEKSQGLQSTRPSAIALEGPSIQATCNHETLVASMETLTATVAAQDKKIDGLCDVIRNLSQVVQSSKRDMQRVENNMTKTTTESKVKYEKVLENSVNLFLGPVQQLLEELRMTRANPPAPVYVPINTPYPPTAPYPPEPSGGNSDWAARDDYAPAEPNRLHYQENYKHRQPVRRTCQFLPSYNLSSNGPPGPPGQQLQWGSSVTRALARAWVTGRPFREPSPQPKTLSLRRVGD